MFIWQYRNILIRFIVYKMCNFVAERNPPAAIIQHYLVLDNIL